MSDSSDPPPAPAPSSDPPPRPRSEPPETGAPESLPSQDRRSLLAHLPLALMTGGLVAGYGACAAMGGRYLFPARRRSSSWLFVARASEVPVGGALSFRTPLGAEVVIARQAETGGVEDFIALSSTCPHLGCQVHWEAANDRFFCPCHNGAFDRDGDPIAGPPAEAGQALPRYPLDLRDGLLYLEAPVEGLTARADARGGSDRVDRVARAGHDPCLGERGDLDPPRDGGGAA